MAMTPSDSRPGERRLHPWSWLFVLLTQLRHIALPALALLLFGSGETWELFGGLAALGLAAYSLVYSFGFRYRIDAEELVVREGIFDRTERHIPFARIQNLTHQRNPLHRLFGVTELRVESAGGHEPEAKMSVITLAEAAELEALLRRHARGPALAVPAATDGSATLHALSFADLLRIGLASNRGMVVVAAAVGYLFQSGHDPKDLPWVQALWDWLEPRAASYAQDHSAMEVAIAVTVAIVLALLLLRLMSISIAILRHYGFRLSREGGRIGTEEGLLTRRHAGAAIDKIQRLSIEEPLLMRWMGRQALRVDVAGGLVAMNDEAQVRLRWLAPIALPAQVQQLIQTLAPSLDAQHLRWQSLHPGAFARMVRAPSVLLGLIALAALLHGMHTGWTVQGWIASLAVGLIVLVWLRARGWLRFTAYAIDADSLHFRQGWLNRQWQSLELKRIQGVLLRQGPLDRWNGMASVAVEVAGTGAIEYSIDIPYLGIDEAQAMYAELSRAASGPLAGR